MNLFSHRAVPLVLAAAVLGSSARAFDDAAFAEVRSRMAALRADRPAAVVEPPPETSFPTFRATFAVSRKPDAAALRINQAWTCYSLRENGAASFDQQTFVSFDGRFLSRGTPEPTQALEYKSNDGALYASFKTGKRAMDFTAVAAYRVRDDGRLIRELTLLYSVWPGAEPSGVRYQKPLALNEAEMDAALRMNSRGTVYSYAVCEPAAK